MTQEAMTTREGLLCAASHEFLETGYKEAALREIAKQAGVTTGALYGYFKNKEELFGALVDEPYHAILDLYNEVLHAFQSLPPEDQFNDMTDYTAVGMKRMMDLMYENHVAFKLMLCCSEGTNYSNLVHEMAELDVKATEEFAATLSDVGQVESNVNPVLEHMLTSGMFAAFFEVIVHDIPREEADEYVNQLLAFYSAGWGKIMGF